MPRVTVLDVGDGACSILRCGCVGAACSCPLAVVDCGVYRGRKQQAADKLEGALGAQGLAQLESLVVTHFDADHWEGLRLLACSLNPGEVPDRVQVVYPRLPDRAPDVAAMHLALSMTVRPPTGTGVRPLDLIDAWQSVTGVERRPVCQGDTFAAAGRQWTVQWPPSVLDHRLRKRLRQALDNFERLANELAEEDFPALRENLAIAREAGFSRRDHESDRDHDRVQVDREPVDEWRDDRPDETEENDASSTSDPNLHGHFPDLSSIPKEFHRPFRDVSKEVAAANNDLSLVFFDHERHLIVFGDVQGDALSAAIAGIDGRFQVMLAPHHGTVRVPKRDFPKACACVAQAGTHHLGHWHNHVERHKQPRSCINTARIGTVSFW